MANLEVRELNLKNPFIIASSPATHGVKAVLKSSKALPGAVVMRNYGHGTGGGSFISPSSEAMYEGKQCYHSHAVGTQIKDSFASFEEYCEAVSYLRKQMPEDVKLWVSVGHFKDMEAGVDWENIWTNQAIELERAGADALELHFNTPGVAVTRNRIYDFYRLIQNTTKMLKRVVKLPIMVKLPVEGCDPLRAMEAAVYGGANAIGPTARWKGFAFDLDWGKSQPKPGSGYGGTQALPIACYTVAEARLNEIKLPMYAGGGIFSWEAAAKLILSGSQCVQLGSLACCLGPKAVSGLIESFDKWMDRSGYSNIEDLCGKALALLTMPKELSEERTRRLGTAYRDTKPDPDLCIGCGNCEEACWYEGISVKDGIAEKLGGCIGCGYCFQVCPTNALHVEAGNILTSVFNNIK